MSRPDSQTSLMAIREPARLQALCHPTRVAMLEALREPRSAAAIARELGQPRQRIGHHMKTLEQAGLVEAVGTRRNGNFVETLYRSAARTFVVAPEIAWADPRRLEILEREHALGTLVRMGERLQRDAVVLLDRAAFDGTQVPSAAVSAEVSFASSAERESFLKEYLRMTRELLERHGSAQGDPFRVVLAVHPDTGRSMQ